MGCGSEYYTSNCVCDTLLAIVEAQEKVNPRTGCTDSCATAIQELLNGVVNGPADYIPVMLICKGTCEPFTGYGVSRGTTGAPFVPVYGDIFRVVDVDPETCCAVLEIIDYGYTGGDVPLAALAAATTLVPTGVCITVDLNCFCGVSCIFPQPLY